MGQVCDVIVQPSSMSWVICRRGGKEREECENGENVLRRRLRPGVCAHAAPGTVPVTHLVHRCALALAVHGGGGGGRRKKWSLG
jgi:hypothetical protein